MKNLRRNVKKNLPLYVMFIPVLIYFVIFRYIPLFLSLIISVEKYQPAKGILESKWVGLQYYGQFINSIFFWRLIRNTLAINFLQLTIGFVAPIILALLLNEVGRLKYKKLVQTVTYLPNFISSVVVVGMVVTFLSPSTGLINNILAGLGFSRINFSDGAFLFLDHLYCYDDMADCRVQRDHLSGSINRNRFRII